MKGYKLFFLLTVVFLGPILFYGRIWFFQFSRLNSHYVEHHYDSLDQKVHYSLVPSRPDYWVSLKKLDKRSYGAIVISEDWRFYEHYGFDIAQIKKAIFSSLEGRKLRGASTITQQLVKNIYLGQERSWLRKGKEALLAIIIEQVLSKERILEIYLNIIEYGQGIYGIYNASLFYFQKFPQKLSSREGAFLAMLLPSPKKYSQSFRNQELSTFASQSIDEILRKMKISGHLSSEEFMSATKNIFAWENRSFLTDDPQYFDLNQ